MAGAMVVGCGGPPSPEAKSSSLEAQQFFQMVESVMKLHAAYRASPRDGSAAEQWMSGWSALARFMEDKPSLFMNCRYAWETHYEVLCALPRCDNFPSELAGPKLADRISIPAEGAAKAQRGFIVDMMSVVLRKDGISAAAAVEALSDRIAPFLQEDAGNHIDEAVLRELRDVDI